MSRRATSPGLVAASCFAALVVVLSGCGRGTGILFPNQRPVVELGPNRMVPDTLFYAIRFQWSSHDPDGRVAAHRYAVDPPAEGDTAWVRIPGEQRELLLFFRSSTPPDSLPEEGPIRSADYHVFVLEAVDDGGLRSAPAYLAFTSATIAPQTEILSPTFEGPPPGTTAPDFVVSWRGEDPDGFTTQEPVAYRTRLVPIDSVLAALRIEGRWPTAGEIQRYLERQAPAFAGWDSLPGTTTSLELRDLRAIRGYLFAVSAVDEAGAYEPRFLRGRNVLEFRVGTATSGPRITIFNSFFHRSGSTGHYGEYPIYTLEVPAGMVIPFHWFAEPVVQGTVVAGYRWVLDPADFFDDTPRERDDQTDRWTPWSLHETFAAVGPFDAVAGERNEHTLHVQARDQFGVYSWVRVLIRAVPQIADRPLLIFDDFRRAPDRSFGAGDPRSFQPYGEFPTEAALDTLLFAVGGVPHRHHPQGASSVPGVFAGFAYDTLDYRFFPYEGLPLSVLSRYQAVVWFVGAADAERRYSKYSTKPMAALRYQNRDHTPNTLGWFLEGGGKAWLFGDGVVTAIANGYVSRFDSTDPAPFPYTGAGEAPGVASILWPGNLLYDFLHVRSEMDLNSRPPAPERELVRAIPYLPAFRTPGAPWPACDWPGTPGPADDPRIGPSAERHRARWDGLPVLTLTTEFADWPTPLPSGLPAIAYVSKPLEVLESGAPALDTLYLMRTREHLPGCAGPDGAPVFFYYHGADHGPVAWTTLPLWMFERTQLQVVAEKVLGQFGMLRNPDRRGWAGPGSAHREPTP